MQANELGLTEAIAEGDEAGSSRAASEAEAQRPATAGGSSSTNSRSDGSDSGSDSSTDSESDRERAPAQPHLQDQSGARNQPGAVRRPLTEAIGDEPCKITVEAVLEARRLSRAKAQEVELAASEARTPAGMLAAAEAVPVPSTPPSSKPGRVRRSSAVGLDGAGAAGAGTAAAKPVPAPAAAATTASTVVRADSGNIGGTAGAGPRRHVQAVEKALRRIVPQGSTESFAGLADAAGVAGYGATPAPPPQPSPRSARRHSAHPMLQSTGFAEAERRIDEAKRRSSQVVEAIEAGASLDALPSPRGRRASQAGASMDALSSPRGRRMSAGACLLDSSSPSHAGGVSSQDAPQPLASPRGGTARPRRASADAEAPQQPTSPLGGTSRTRGTSADAENVLEQALTLGITVRRASTDASGFQQPTSPQGYTTRARRASVDGKVTLTANPLRRGRLSVAAGQPLFASDGFASIIPASGQGAQRGQALPLAGQAVLTQAGVTEAAPLSLNAQRELPLSDSSMNKVAALLLRQ
eukprot:TRINITY_DN29449_c1_g1_i1.p1 TRINITY_DN29449_c1_g1~~TRINITY_DN29449_c1_g1_i1.p1  ORF type:complete len:526 (+),score=95.82 TRINITY_DN29449_c1_g1_i1:174-1751(+)